MNDLETVLSKLPPPGPDGRLDQINEYLWRKVDARRLSRERIWVCSGVVAATFMIGILVGHISETPQESAAATVLISDLV